MNCKNNNLQIYTIGYCLIIFFCSFIDPKIGSEGLGRVFIGPATPFGMVRPGPDCTPSPNSGWLPMPERVDGFAQTHVSGTGGGPKYGNILIQPYVGDFSLTTRPAYREEETIEAGYYSTIYKESGIKTEVTTAPRASAYRITYPAHTSKASLLIDAGFFLGETPVPDAREAQQFVGSEIAVVSDREVCGYSRIRGGWNNGRAYTVYFHAESDVPFTDFRTWQGESIGNEPTRTDHGKKTGAMLRFPEGTDTLNIRIGISFISPSKAKENLIAETSGKSFDDIHARLLVGWEALTDKFQLAEDTPEEVKRMFYTGLYHTMLMPSDRTGENPLWTDEGVPYYDDFYAIWDTYRTSFPLITLMDPQRSADMVNSLVNIGKRDGFMPDARSGNCNGRTQGGSNADVVIADAYVKGIKGIDYEAALREMLKDGETDPGAEHEMHGRGGLTDYIRLGYVPHGTDRAGNRTVEYSLCDNAIATVARGLGHNDIADRYAERSHNWKNLWRTDYEHDGAKGFIMPKSKEGEWLDSIPYGASEFRHKPYIYTPVTFEGPWYTPWWSMFFYEASSWEYSLSMPHDVTSLIEACGGAEAFEKRLDTFFEKGYYNVNNEPSFLTPCLYHWIGRPEKSAARIRQIVRDNFNDSPKGLPGNDDSGAMSSWLAFHILGLYPNAGQDYYLLNPPMTPSWSLTLPDGMIFKVTTEGWNPDECLMIESAVLNGKPYDRFTLSHADIMAGGHLHLVLTSNPERHPLPIANPSPLTDTTPSVSPFPSPLQRRATFKLHGQTRRFDMAFTPTEDGGIRVDWQIERNLRMWHGSYTMDVETMENASDLSLLMPEDGNHVNLSGETFCMLSRRQLKELKKNGTTLVNGIRYVLTEKRDVLTARSESGNSELQVVDDPNLPIVVSFRSEYMPQTWRLD